MEDINIIRDTLEEELERNRRSCLVCRQEIDALPRGSVTVRTRRGRPYCYLKYREGKRVVTKYVGPEEKVGEDLRASIARRRALQATLRRLEKEQAFIQKALGRNRHA